MGRLKPFVFHLALLGGLAGALFLYIPAGSRSEASVRLSAASSQAPPQGLILDAVDGMTVAKAWVNTVDSSGATTSREVSSADGLTWTIVSGAGQISEDSFTKRTLFQPQGNVPLVVQPVLAGQAGPAVTVGLNVNTIPVVERQLDAAGGGACEQNLNHAGLFAAMVDVRAVVDASVIPLSATERLLRYQRAEYYAYDPQAGPMRITLNPDKVSEVRLSSLQAAGSPSFFPASAEASLYFIIEMLNTGVRIFNPQPMVLRNPSTSWPPFQEPMINDTPVSFVLVDNPTVEMMLIDSQESYLYPSTELAVDLLSQQTNAGILEASYRIRNLATTGGDVRWFFLGDLGTPLTPTRGVASIPPGGSTLVSLQTQLASSTLSQRITLGAVTQSGPRLTGLQRLELHFPEVSMMAQPGATTARVPAASSRTRS